MSDIHALSGAYALDALHDLERAEFERHLAGCASCRTEVDSLRDAAVHLADLSSTAPPADLRAKILAEVQTVRPLRPQTVSPTRSGRRLPAVAAAAATAGRRRPDLVGETVWGRRGRTVWTSARILARRSAGGAVEDRSAR